MSPDHFYRRRSKLLDHDRGIFRFDIPGPMTLEWSTRTAGKRSRHAAEHPIPVITGLAFAAAPYFVGAALVAWAPHPAAKAAGVSMLVPTGVGEAFWFSVGYGVGTQIEDVLF